MFECWFLEREILFSPLWLYYYKQVLQWTYLRCMGRRYLNLFGNKLHFLGELCLSLWRVPKTLIMNQRCSLGGLSSVVIKHRLCEKTVTYAVDWISHVWKTPLSSPSCLCEPVRVGSSRTGVCPSLTWNHLWGTAEAWSSARAPLRAPFP